MGEGPVRLRRVIGRGRMVHATMAERCESLRTLDNPHVAVPSELVMEDDVVVAYFEARDGVDLRELLEDRGGLSAGQCVELGVSVARALDSLHGAGLCHGDLSPANIVLERGEAVLADTLGGIAHGSRGTPGFASPERPDRPSAAGDVFSLGRVLEWCVSPADAARLAPWIAPLMEREPSSRPTAHAVAIALRGCAEPAPLPRPARPDVVRSLRLRASGSTEERPAGRGWRLRRTLTRVAALAGAAAVCAGAVAVGAVLIVGSAEQPPEVPVARVSVAPAASSAPGLEAAPASTDDLAADAAQAATELTYARFAALVDGDGQALLGTMAAGSEARAGSEDLAAALDSGEMAFESLAVAVVEAEVISVTAAAATVVTRYEVQDYSVVVDGTIEPRDGFAETAVLRLERDDSWLVASVSVPESP